MLPFAIIAKTVFRYRVRFELEYSASQTDPVHRSTIILPGLDQTCRQLLISEKVNIETTLLAVPLDQQNSSDDENEDQYEYDSDSHRDKVFKLELEKAESVRK